ncbi:pyruvate ferredoxin oxidoreductase subunit beta [Fibrobacterales bacterium]|nr:pyruvate ferredoxin oxidoreductase subunit beta [Fibrobacterales bacterium]
MSKNFNLNGDFPPNNPAGEKVGGTVGDFGKKSPTKVGYNKDKEPFVGHKACAGCGGTIAVRLALKALGERVFVTVPAGCMSAVGFLYPQMAFTVNSIISTFAGTASMLTGIRAAANAKGLKDVFVVGFAGDGGTADIGIQALSGAIERGDKIIYICYDNEAYMNTGIQRSSATPFGASTTTSPAGSVIGGNRLGKKDMFSIVAAHNIPYAATASIAYPHDYIKKVKKAAATDGPSYIHILAPCPTGWGSENNQTVNLARLAVETGLWQLKEFAGGEVKITHKPKELKSIEEYLRLQKRFRHLNAADVDRVKESIG